MLKTFQWYKPRPGIAKSPRRCSGKAVLIPNFSVIQDFELHEARISHQVIDILRHLLIINMVNMDKKAIKLSEIKKKMA